MKICVITLLNVRNYGSVLQTLATQEILKNLGYEVEFIDYIREVQTEKSLTRSYMNGIPNNQVVRRMYNKFFNMPITNSRARKIFRGFVLEYINLTNKQYISSEELKRNLPNADIYCTGSDQMWNSGWNNGIEEAFFLDFVEGKPKISFSTSFGLTEIPKNEEERTITLLKRYNFISVREQSAVSLLSKYDIKSINILDPTLMLSGDFWFKFAHRSSHKKDIDKYILVYQLHQEHGEVDFTHYVKKVSKTMDLPVKVISYGMTLNKVYDEYLFMPTMQDFVGAFARAEYIITDSFHGTSFSIVLNKSFTVAYPNSYSTRIKNILELTGLEGRVLEHNDALVYDNAIDFTTVNDKLRNLQRHSLEVIEKGLINVVSDINKYKI